MSQHEATSSSENFEMTSNAAFPHAPWQFDWKSPQFHTLRSSPTSTTKTTTSTTTNEPILGHAAARIQLSRDLPVLYNSDTSSDNNQEYMLTVTLQGNGRDLDLQVWRQPQSTASTSTTRRHKQAPAVQLSLLATRSLQWPTIADDDKNHKPSTLSAVGLARKPPANALTSWTDALDVLHWLSLDRSSEITPVQRDWLQHLQRRQQQQEQAQQQMNDNNTDKDEPDEGALLLLLLDTHHVLYAYTVRNIWRAETNYNNQNDHLAAFLLGDDLLQTVQTRLWPLTQPWQQTRLRDWEDPLERTRDGPSAAAFGTTPITTTQQPIMCAVADLWCLGRGAVCTFVSLRTLEPVRHVHVPFGPQALYPWHWNGWIFVLVVGAHHEMCAIRVDAGMEHDLVAGEAPTLFQPTTTTTTTSTEPLLHVGRFQILPVAGPVDNARSLRMLIGSTGIHCAAVYQSEGNSSEEQIVEVVQYKFGSIDTLPQDRPEMVDIYGSYRPPNLTEAGLPVLKLHRDTVVATLTTKLKVNPWCFTRHGWGLLGLGRELYWIGWQGQRKAVAYCHHVATLSDDDESPPVVEAIQSLEPWKHGVPDSASSVDITTGSSFRDDTKDDSGHKEILDVDSLILDAMESISALNYRSSASPPASPLRRFRKALTQKEKSERLLRQCSSWTRLVTAETSPDRLDFVEPVVSIRYKGSHHVLTMRQVDFHHAEEAPFDLILAWLAHHKDFFTAASLSLELLQDRSSLRHLWESYGKISAGTEDDGYAVLDGLLDGVADASLFDNKRQPDSAPNANVGKLAGMTINCLTRGGFPMSTTLEHFLLRDKHYDASRAALTLVATAACCLSDDEDSVALAMGADYQKTSQDKSDNDAILWPVRSLLNVGIARDMLGTILILLNATIPDTLRNRKSSDLASAIEPSLSLCKSLVSLIVGSSPEAPELLLSLTDEQTRVPYFNSLDHKTQLELSLVRVREKDSPMLFQPPVRNWVLSQLQDCLATEGSAQSVNVYEKTPDRWLQELVMSCLRNADCSLEDVVATSMPADETGNVASFEAYCTIVERGRDLVLSSKGTFGIDFDLVIGVLLVLERRGIEWRKGAIVSCQHLLNAACHFAGRRSQRETVAPLNAPTLMRQCFLAGNVQAGANLIGGFNGLVLGCCNVLVDVAGLDIDAAEKFLLGDILSIDGQTTPLSGFAVNEAHFEILWLLREHTLRVQNYGDFAISTTRGRVDPVRAARVCLRAWWRVCLTTEGSSQWLVQWLQDQLEMEDNRSQHRLACAALLRALIWPSEGKRDVEPSKFLASSLRIPNSFLTQLALSACGLVEAIPPEFLELPMAAPPASGMKSSTSIGASGTL